MRSIFSLLTAALVVLPLAAYADGPGGTSNSMVLPSNDHALSRVHANLNADATKPSGPQRDVAMTDKPSAAPKSTERPAPTPRMLRKMAPEHAIAAIDPAVRACAVSNPTTAPLSFGMRVVVSPTGAVESSDLAAGTSAPPAVIVCVSAAVSAAHFGTPGPNGATIALPITVPGRPAPAAKPAKS